MSDEIEPRSHEATKPAIPLILTGEMTECGDMIVNGDDCRGVFIEIPKEQLAQAGYIPLFSDCTVITVEQFKEITAKLEMLELSIADLSHPNMRMLLAERDALKEELAEMALRYKGLCQVEEGIRGQLASADREIERLNLMVQMMDESEELATIQQEVSRLREILSEAGKTVTASTVDPSVPKAMQEYRATLSSRIETELARTAGKEQA